MSSLRYRPAHAQVVHETFEDEVVIIDLTKGAYFSVSHVGVDIWNLLQQGRTEEEIIEQVVLLYEGGREEIEDAVRELLAEFQREGLIVPDEILAEATRVPVGQPEDGSSAGEKRSFEKPRLYKYTDMQDLLMLDPVHEVNETGWPRKH